MKEIKKDTLRPYESTKEENNRREASGEKVNKGEFIILILIAVAFIFFRSGVDLHNLFSYGADLQSLFARGNNTQQNKIPMLAQVSSKRAANPGDNNQQDKIPVQNIMTVEILKEKILEQQKLVTCTDTLEVSLESALSKLSIPFTNTAVPGTKRQFKLTVPVTVDLTTDLQNMEISYDQEGNAASVKIPEAEIFRVKPDISNMKDVQEIGFFRSRMSAEEQQAMLIEAEQSARAQIYERNYISFANHRARDLLEKMIKRFGVRYVEVEVM